MNVRVLRAIACEGRGTVATVFAVRGSSPARLGHKMLVRPDGSQIGTIGGSEMELRCVRRAGEIRASEILTFELFYKKAEGLDLACGGSVDILLDPLTTASVQVYAQAERWVQARMPFVLVAGPGVRGVVSQSEAVGDPIPVGEARRVLQRAESESSKAVLYEYVRPRPFVLLVGGGHINTALAKLLTELEYFYTVVDSRSEFRERFPGALSDLPDVAPYTHIVICTHSQDLDYRALRHVCACGYKGYVGLIGSKSKRADFWPKLRAEGVSEETLNRIEIPIGQSIGAETVQEIALSIAASLVKSR